MKMVPSLDVYCDVTNLPKSWQLKTANIYLIQILRAESLVAAQVKVYGSESLMRLQSRSTTELQSSEGLTALGGIHFQAPSHGYHQEVSVPHYIGLSIGLRNNTWIPQSEWSKIQCDQDGSCSVFYNLILEVPYHHFCYIYWSHKPVYLLVTQTTHKLGTMWEGSRQGYEF